LRLKKKNTSIVFLLNSQSAEQVSLAVGIDISEYLNKLSLRLIY
jgi:hypothetical protein